ncbi:hypothetical protein HMPREF0541_02676 [Lacticaseibacillus rhamnosus ATCC 21052]|nr:hypothetical protein HMPREF0541_02676 [Lacticaseibacillus rhamnosus ATCC 21052]
MALGVMGGFGIAPKVLTRRFLDWRTRYGKREPARLETGV